MNEYTSLVEKGQYELRFTTNDWATFREIEDKMREIIDRNRQPHSAPMCVGNGGSRATGSMSVPMYPMSEDK